MAISNAIAPGWAGAALLLGALCTAPGCSNDDPAQIETVQILANALRTSNLKVACAVVVPVLRSPVTCQGLIAQIMHYSPGFRAARIERRGPSSGWRYSTQIKVPVRFIGPDGQGNLDVTLARAKTGWEIAGLIPAR